MEVISSKSFEEDSSEDENNENEHFKYNSEPYYQKYSQNKLDFNNISEDEEIENNDNENNLNEMEMNRINEINELDEDEEETDGNIENNMDEHFEENEISNSVKNAENNTINTIDEENDEYNENSYNNNSNNNIDENMCNYMAMDTNNKQNIQMLVDNGLNKQIPFISFENDKFIICEEAKKLFNQIGNNKIGIISFMGEYRSKDDKIFLLNKILSNNTEIDLLQNNQNNNNNNGILIYSKPLIIKNNFCDEEFPCFIIDTINFNINMDDNVINHDKHIFLIIILISSLLIFNSIGNIGDNSLININFILKLIKTIKLKNTLDEVNESILVEFLPILLWVLQNSNLKLEDKNGNTITEKQYMETCLQLINGNSDTIEENNRIKTMIKSFFPERDCYVMMDSSNISVDKSKNKKKKPKYEEQINILKNKIIKKIKPKMFYNNYLTGNMLIELIESLLNNINTGGSPILSNSWKYIMKSECMKIANDLIFKFVNELKEYRNQNINKNVFFNNTQIEKFKFKIIQKYMKEFNNNNILDEETKKEYYEKIKSKLDTELKKYEKENEKYFEEKFIKDLNLLSNKFMENFTSSDIYEKNSYKFFQDFENFREAAIQAAPDFPHKNEILFDKVLLIIKKFINGKIMKIKVINEEKNYLENENKKQEIKLNELNSELNMIKEKNNEFIQKLNNDIQSEKKKYKRVEDKINGLINNKTKDIENLKKEIEIETNNYERKIKEIIETNNNLNKEIKLKDEQLHVMKMNNEKISSLYEQKSKFLEKEISSWKDKYTITIKEGLIKENDLTKENIKLKEQNKILIKKEKNKREELRNINNSNNNSVASKHSNNNIKENININLNGIDGNDNNNNTNNKIIKNNINGLMSYIKMNFKDKKSKMLKLDKFFLNKKKQSQERVKDQKDDNYNNYYENDISDSNHRDNSLKSNNNVKKNSFNNYDSNNSSKSKDNKKKIIDGQLINFNQYKDLINNAKDFKCKFCMKNFNFPDFKEHYNICPKNPINMNTMNNSNIQDRDRDSNEKSSNKAKMNSNSNTIFTSEKMNNSHLENDYNNDNISINKSTIKKFTLSNSSINTNHNSSINNIVITNNTNLKNTNANNKNINNNNSNGNNNVNDNNRVYISTNKVLNYRNKKDNSYSNNNLTNINTSNTINNSDNTSTKGTNAIESNINNKKANYRNINLYYFDNNKNNNNNSKSNVNTNNIFVPQKLKIKIIKGRIRKDKSGKPYLEYIININYDGVMNWNINRRFNQFTNLYKTLRTISKESFEMPESSNIFNNITALFSGLSHENKILQLEKFLKDLTETQGISNSKHLYCFLELNNLIDENNILINNNSNSNNNNGIINNYQRRNIDNIPKNKNNILVSNSNNKHYYNNAGLSINNTSGLNTAINSNINSNINTTRFKIINGVLE